MFHPFIRAIVGAWCCASVSGCHSYDRTRQAPPPSAVVRVEFTEPQMVRLPDTVGEPVSVHLRSLEGRVSTMRGDTLSVEPRIALDASGKRLRGPFKGPVTIVLDRNAVVTTRQLSPVRTAAAVVVGVPVALVLVVLISVAATCKRNCWD
jgi:hypothetical protein